VDRTVVVGLVLPQEIGDKTLRLRGCVRVVHRVVWSVVCGITLSPMSHPWLERKSPTDDACEGGVLWGERVAGMVVYLIA
jgi:hypothetical protein